MKKITPLAAALAVCASLAACSALASVSSAAMPRYGIDYMRKIERARVA